MGITPNKNNKTIIKETFAKGIENLEKVIVNVFSSVGESAAMMAKNEGSYTDRTGNLRSSVGYLIAVRGEVMKSFFEGLGASEGERFAREKLTEINVEYVLIVVAGMKYASYVEKKDYDVLLFTKVRAESLAIELFEQL